LPHDKNSWKLCPLFAPNRNVPDREAHSPHV